MPRATVPAPDLAGSLWWGNGVLGSVVLAANTTLTADAYYQNLTVPAGINLHTNGYRLFVAGQLIVAGTILNKGGDAAGSVAGTGAPAGSIGGGTAGAAGAVGAGGNGVAQTESATPNGIGGAGGNSGATAGGAGGTVAAPPASQTGPGDLLGSFYALTAGSTISPFSGGSGGGAGAGDGANAGGAGGGGGGIVMISARLIVVSAGGIIQANGGAGGNGAGGNAAGGGGGGAGAIFINTTTQGLLILPGGIVGKNGVSLHSGTPIFGAGNLTFLGGFGGAGVGTGAAGARGGGPAGNPVTIGVGTLFYNVLPL